VRLYFSFLAQFSPILVFEKAYMIDPLDTFALQIHQLGQFAIQILDIFRYQLAGEQSL